MSELLDEVIDAHGGAERWKRVDELIFDARGGGLAIAMKGKARKVRHFEARISTAVQQTVLAPYPKAGQRGVFSAEEVWIEADDGKQVRRREAPERRFEGLGRLPRQVRGDDLDFLYFAGYALWGYATAPFVFTRPGFETRELDPWEEDGQMWRRLEVSFPGGWHAHCAQQTFYFDRTGLLGRIDYTAEVFGKWVRSAHYCAQHETFDGLVFPTKRWVVPRLRSGRSLRGPRWVTIDVESVRTVAGRSSKLAEPIPL
jgi:hypothetical protein